MGPRENIGATWQKMQSGHFRRVYIHYDEYQIAGQLHARTSELLLLLLLLLQYCRPCCCRY
jgi:hypothetical protein